MKQNKFLLIVILGLMSAIGPFSIDYGLDKLPQSIQNKIEKQKFGA